MSKQWLRVWWCALNSLFIFSIVTCAVRSHLAAGEPNETLATATSAVAAQAGDTLQMLPAESGFPRREDYALLWWADGFLGRSPTGQWHRVLQTGRYALVLDMDRMSIAHLGAIADGPSYADAATHGNALWRKLPPAQLDLEITLHGTTYRCVRGTAPTADEGPRIIDSGRFVQRADVTKLVFESSDGKTLPVEARFETCGWPDHLALTLEAFPALQPVTAGSQFGRVGGGYGFDGQNELVESLSAEDLPAEFTLSCWVYLPPDFCATQLEPWVLCAQGNEWVDGHCGIILTNHGVPRAVLNIGGGRDNCYAAIASHADGRGQMLTTECWHHLAMTYDGASLRLYVDGRAAGERTVNRPRVAGPVNLTFARRGDNSGDGYRLRAVLDEVSIHRRALEPEAIARMAAEPSHRDVSAETRRWSFAEDGTALERRPADNWDDASMAVRVTTRDGQHAQSIQQTSETRWTESAPGRVTLALKFDPKSPQPQTAQVAHDAPALDVVATDAATSKALSVVAEPEFGWFRVRLDGVTKEGDERSRIERARLRLRNRTDVEQPVRLFFEKTEDLPITGMLGVLRDSQGNPTGIPVQLSKNWHRNEQRRLKFDGPWYHGFSYLYLPAHSELELELVLLGATWGGVPAASHAQLCLVGWGSNQLWDQTAMGSFGENFCFEPDRTQATAMICDVRPLMVNAMNCATPTQWSWTNNVGGGDAYRLFAPDGSYVRPVRMQTTYLRQGPCLTEVRYTGTLADDAISHALTTSLYRSDDMARCVYRLRFDVTRPVEFSRFVILQVGADTYGYTAERKMAIGNVDGLQREWATQWGGNRYRTEPQLLTGDAPWISLHEAVSRDTSASGAWANRGLVIRAWRAKLGGRESGPWVAEHGVTIGGVDTSSADIVPPADVKRLEPGDFVEAEIEHLVVPQFARDYYGPNQNLRDALRAHEDTWHMVHREAAGNDLHVTARIGDVEHQRPVAIRSAGDRAEFTISGGLGYVPLSIRGLHAYQAPHLEMLEADGTWRAVNQSVHGNDFWQTDYDPQSRTWEITFTVPADAPQDQRAQRTFRFFLGNSRVTPR